MTIIEITLTKAPTAAQKGSTGYQTPIKLDNPDFLTKEKWEEQEKNMEERRNRPRGEKKEGEEREPRKRGEQRTRGRRK